jgi:hypothetical protein
MENREYRLHQGARTALNVAGILCLVLIIGAPFGIWILWRVAGGKIILSPGGVVAKALMTVSFDWKDVDRIGVVRVPIIARGIGGMLARKKVGGDHSVNVCVKLRNQKKRMIIISQFEDYQTAMEQISSAVGKPYEELTMGAFGVKWPEAKAA